MKKISVITLVALFCGFVHAAETAKKPNIVVVFTDDQGYADLGCFGGTHVYTPRIDQMAAEGAKLTNFYVSAPLCTPSRAGLMTGSYPARIDMTLGGKRLGSKKTAGVLLSADPKGLNPDEVTIAEVLKKAGYKTGIFGKWHLGDQPDFLPTKQGFDEFFGLPYSHDINPVKGRGGMFPSLPLLEGEKVIDLDPSPDQLTRMFTHRAIDFIKRHKDELFFLYVPHPMPHGPLHVSPEFMKEAPERLKKEAERNTNVRKPDPNSKHLYALTVAEIDWSVGQILDTLKAEGLDKNTLVIFTTDNGPWCTSAAPLRGKKNDSEEGGMRVPAVIRWPGKISAGQVNDELMSTMDLLPTFARLAGAELPSDRVIDGKDIWPVLTKGEKTPHDAYFYYEREVLKAVRSGDWKLFVKDGKPTELYNLRDDISEANNQLRGRPEVVERLHALIKTFQEDLSQNSRSAAFVENPKPLTIPTK